MRPFGTCVIFPAHSHEDQSPEAENFAANFQPRKVLEIELHCDPWEKRAYLCHFVLLTFLGILTEGR